LPIVAATSDRPLVALVLGSGFFFKRLNQCS